MTSKAELSAMDSMQDPPPTAPNKEVPDWFKGALQSVLTGIILFLAVHFFEVNSGQGAKLADLEKNFAVVTQKVEDLQTNITDQLTEIRNDVADIKQEGHRK